jgi:hypothetical protein
MRQLLAAYTWPTAPIDSGPNTTSQHRRPRQSTLPHPIQERGFSSAIALDSSDTYASPEQRTPVTREKAPHRDLRVTRTSEDSHDEAEYATEDHTVAVHQSSIPSTHDVDLHSRSSAEELNSDTRVLVNPTFEAIETPPNHIPLDFRPTMLKPQITIAVCCLYVLLTVGVSCLAVLPNGKIAYSIKNDTYYFAIRYGPGLVAAVSTFLFKSVTQEFLRMLPYINMANPKGPSSPRYSILAQYWPLLLDPNSWRTWIANGLLRFSPFLISYKAILFEIDSKGTSWELRIHPSVAIPLIGYYAILAIYVSALTIWM